MCTAVPQYSERCPALTSAAITSLLILQQLDVQVAVRLPRGADDVAQSGPARGPIELPLDRFARAAHGKVSVSQVAQARFRSLVVSKVRTLLKRANKPGDRAIGVNSNHELSAQCEKSPYQSTETNEIFDIGAVD